MTAAPNRKLRATGLIFSMALIVALAAVWFSPLAGAQETPPEPTGELVVVPQTMSLMQMSRSVVISSDSSNTPASSTF